MEKDSISSENKAKIDDSTKARSDTQSNEGEEDSKVFDDFVCEEYLYLGNLASSSVSGSPDISGEKKQTVESLKIKPFIIKKVKTTKVIRLLGVDIHVATNTEHIVVLNPRPLPCFNPRMAEFIPEQSHNPLGHRGGHMENIEPQPRENFAGLLQNIEDRLGVRPVLMYQKNLTKSDVSSNLNRLFITRSQELMGFLRKEERRRVEGDDKNTWLDVSAIGPRGESYKLHLKMWHSLSMLVINGKEWNTVVFQNKLKAGYLLELWAYREQDTELRLAMNFKSAE